MLLLILLLTTNILINIKNMAKLSDIANAVSDLQNSLDLEQKAILAALAGMQSTIDSLNQMIVDGGTESERQAVLDQLSAVKADLESTIA